MCDKGGQLFVRATRRLLLSISRWKNLRAQIYTDGTPHAGTTSTTTAAGQHHRFSCTPRFCWNRPAAELMELSRNENQYLLWRSRAIASSIQHPARAPRRASAALGRLAYRGRQLSVQGLRQDEGDHTTDQRDERQHQHRQNGRNTTLKTPQLHFSERQVVNSVPQWP